MACYSFQQSGNCKFGESCRFSHGSSEPPGGAPSSGYGAGDRPAGGDSRYNDRPSYGSSDRSGGGGGGPCYQFQDSGSCRYGDSCRFSHGGAPAQGGGGGGGYDRRDDRRDDRRSNDRGFGAHWGSSGGNRNYGDRNGGGGGGSGPCYSYRESGNCRYGDSCRFTHDGAAPSGGAGGDRYGGGGDRYGGGGDRYGSRSGGGGSGPCYQFQSSGNCKYGESCRFSHGDVASSGRDSYGNDAAPAAADAAPVSAPSDGQPQLNSNMTE